MIFDLHNDFPTTLKFDYYRRYLTDCLNANAVPTAAIWTSEFDCDSAAMRVEKIYGLLKELSPDTPIAIEDIGFTANGELYKTFDFSRFIYCSLTWNFNNVFAGGALDDGILTSAGVEVISRMNKCGCMIDVAHLNRSSFYAAVERATCVICSHTGFNSHKRSLDDSRIRALIDKKGIIGLCVVSAFTDAYDSEGWANVIDRFVQKYGADFLSVGTDFNGSKDMPDDLCDYYGINKAANILRRRGYSADDIDKIFYKNAKAILQRSDL